MYDIFAWETRRTRVKLSAKYRFRLPPAKRSYHYFELGNTGSGKSELFKSQIHQDIVYDDCAVIVIDPNGDLAEQVAQFSENAWEHRREKLLYIDPHLSNDRIPTINPFYLKSRNEDIIDIAKQEMFSVLMKLFRELGFGESGYMEDLLLFGLHIIYSLPNGTLWDLKRLRDARNNQDLLAFARSIPNRGVQETLHDFDLEKYEKTKE